MKFDQPIGVLKNKHQAVSQGDYGLEAWRLERWEAKKGIKDIPSSIPAFYLRTYNAFTKAAQRRITV